MEEEYQTSNINEAWLKNIFEQLKATQTMERLANEGCNELMEYMQIPFDMRKVILPDVQYKNIKFLALELKLLINNLTPILNGKEDSFRKMLKPILENIDKRNLFLKEKSHNGQLIYIEVLPLLMSTLRLLGEIKSGIIKDIAPILYIKEDEKKKW